MATRPSSFCLLQNLIVMALAFLILLGATVILPADFLSDKKPSLLPPANFTVTATGLAQVLLRWEPSPDQERRSIKLGYHVKINGPQEDDYETSDTESSRETVLHEGFSASVRTIPWEGHPVRPSGWVTAGLSAPAGAAGTSAVNLTCTANTAASEGTRGRQYRVSLRCSWLPGQASPEDTWYFLYYRYGSQTEECREYGRDVLGRSVAGWFPGTVIPGRGRDLLAVRVNGSSRHAAIRPLDRLFALHAIDQVNPPLNVTAGVEGTRLSVQWDKPISAFPTHCFEYEVKIHNARKGYFQVEKMTTQEFTSTVHGASRYSLQVRAAVSPVCRPAGPWSAWTRPVVVGSDERKPWAEWFLIALAAAVGFLFAFSLIRRASSRCHPWATLFPPVPAPKSHIKDFIVSINYEKSGSGETEVEVMSYAEEQELEVLDDFVF
uniref:Interleukin 5 receptor subunit alpha n=1 Tax=Rousettus aegyptiacus TaxID=9407 RepID=A0A7J8HQ49_ROUAE|nr:interleukin 5 receptor subunit alpha [Rousettus aegyptiacus]